MTQAFAHRRRDEKHVQNWILRTNFLDERGVRDRAFDELHPLRDVITKAAAQSSSQPRDALCPNKWAANVGADEARRAGDQNPVNSAEP